MEFLNGSREEFLTWERAGRILKIYEDAKKLATGNAEQRRIHRMRIALNALLDELAEELSEESDGPHMGAQSQEYEQ
jgi:hypothetical protein